MAQVILTSVGQAIGGPIGGAVGSTLGRVIDGRVISGLEPARQKGPRLEALKVQGSAEGAPMACVFGRARVTGQVIWATRFLEGRHTSTGGKGGPRTVEYDYSLSFAVALCEGEIDGIGRVWADGRPMDLSGVTMRVHRGGDDQTPDPLIEAVEGAAPAYRGTAYVVFEDLPLGPYGNRPPQLGFEVFRRARGDGPRLEDRLEGVCLVPGAGEFVLATEPVMRRQGLTRTTAENLHAAEGRTDLTVSLDHLQAQCSNLKRVSLVVGWFGDDLRAGHCTIRPGVERAVKPTMPLAWSVAGLGRTEAHLISQSGGGPAYGGTPSDDSVRQAVAELKTRGLAVTLYPFVFMDVPPGNGLPDPYGGVEQAAYPWRGRIKGEDGAAAAGQIDALFGSAQEWGLRRLALHYATLAAQTGADGLLIGSEMRGLTGTRDADGGFPAVAQLRTLAAECRAVVGPGVAISYAADWSEYAGPRDGGEAAFHLDPLWADANIDYVGVDWYPPLGDWRAGGGGVDGEVFAGPDDPAYLATQVAGGEGFGWFYASDVDRLAQARTQIADTAHGEDWVFRVKDLKGWWSNAHHDRPGGVRSGSPTDWVPGMKPIRLTEFGCAAVDRGGNAPNLFQDAKSAESALPPFSTGARNDRMQRRALEAVLGHFAETEHNPLSALYGEPMLSAADVWCWDARPYPAFPARAEIWSDAGAWRTGHWLNGRLAGETRDLIAAVLRRGGLEDDAFEIGGFAGEVQGYVIDRPMRTRDALEPLLTGLGLIAAERDGRVAVIGDEATGRALAARAMALPDAGPSLRAERLLELRPGAARVRHIDGQDAYQTGSVVVRSPGDGGWIDLDLPAVCSGALARAAAARALEAGQADRLTVALAPLDAMTLEPGDTVTIEGLGGGWRVMRLDVEETPEAVLEPVSMVDIGEDDGLPATEEAPAGPGAPFFRLIELPPLIGGENDGRPIAMAAADPWRSIRVFAGADAGSLTARGDVAQPATVGALVEPLAVGARHRWDEANALLIRIEGRAPESRPPIAVFAGGNVVAIETPAGWELVQFRSATLVAEDLWRLTGLLRGQQGTTAAEAADGAVAVFLDHVPTRAESPRAERGLPLIWRAGPANGPAGGGGVSEIAFTMTGVHDRPWSPAHLRATARPDGGIDLGWIARSRIDSDRWDGETVASDALRFRVRVLDGAEERRAFEVAAAAAIYDASDLAADFPNGPGPEARVAVAQWSSGYGWGVEARTALAV
ncbi:MAG: glycoside hydrolase/phage tail family protein [Brevundimonas sp.]|uniref:baseplate multidomain protein megatron n=2 Tax=Brevundimonas sp. TaxID=1871086 RepID=UPI002718CA6D|nr:glycoside hydrolase/phage tail family protein [Brevundimonas sp.]MDO9587485.1 glycoside hydrolase/phage tail family protein [Brevundimonas sp.]